MRDSQVAFLFKTLSRVNGCAKIVPSLNFQLIQIRIFYKGKE